RVEKLVKRCKWRRNAPRAREKPGADSKTGLQTSGERRKSQKITQKVHAGREQETMGYVRMHIKTIISIIAVLVTATLVSAQTLYEETFGGASSPGTLSQVGWSNAVGSFSGYDGIYAQSGAVDYNTGQTLPENTVYLGGEAAASSAIFATDSSGEGTLGTASFSDINPSLYPSLVFSVESQQSYQATNANNYFAIQVEGSWYASTTAMTLPGTGVGSNFVLQTLTYNPTASNWNTFAISGTSVTLGGLADANVSGNITGVGILQTDVSSGGSWISMIFKLLQLPNLEFPNPRRYCCTRKRFLIRDCRVISPSAQWAGPMTYQTVRTVFFKFPGGLGPYTPISLPPLRLHFTLPPPSLRQPGRLFRPSIRHFTLA
ncbi:MAG: hypothetical protein ABR955_11750, partial [Verrucomicrobiota bacterium]